MILSAKTNTFKRSCLIPVMSACALGVFAFRASAESAANGNEDAGTHVYVTWDRFEADRCVAAWLIKRFVDPLAEFEFLPVGSAISAEGCIAFDTPGAQYERAPGRSVSEVVLAETGVRDPALDRIVQLVRAIEVAFWMLDQGSEEVKLRNALQELWTQGGSANERLAPIFAYLDRVRTGGGIAFAKPRQGMSSAGSRIVAPDHGHQGLHNVLTVTNGVVSGSLPEGDAGFDTLVRMGVRTVISVDGAQPDVERARPRGMRYVHIPVGYNGITPAQQLQLAKAARDLPGPIYIHCHHGKHRGPTAAAVAAVALGQMSREEALKFMKKAGTSESYHGLYACVSKASTIEPASLDAASPDFPEISRVSGLVETMVRVDLAFGHIRAIRAAGWHTPADHPDLVPVAEATRLSDLLWALKDDAAVRAKPKEFARLLGVAAENAKALQEALAASASDQLEGRFRALSASCKDCHSKYRD
jgi:protein tyrosine phosphatase (PTP) superfamily phosphohydrolase (DUF442 family)